MSRSVKGPDGVVHQFPDDATDAEIGEALAGMQQPAKPVGQRVEGDTFSEKIANAAKMVGSALPAAGGIAGGILGGAPGAAVGGAAGEGYRQLAQHYTEIPGAIRDVASNLIHHPVATAEGANAGINRGGMNVAAEAATQAGAQAVGDAVVKGGTVLGKWLMNRATSRVTARLMQDFPELSDTLIENALTVSKGGEGRARSLLMTAKGKANAALKTADAAGAEIPIVLNGDLAESLKTALLEKAVKSGGVASGVGAPLTTAMERLNPPMRALFKEIDAAAQGGTLKLSPTHADLLKTQLQKESRALYANRVAPNGPKALGMDATARAEYATQLNSALDAVAGGYKAANAEARPLIGAMRGIQQAIRPNGNLLQAMVRPAVGAATGGAIGGREGGTPGSIAGGIIGAAATSPAGMSREAIILAHPAFQGALRSLPKPLASWLLDLVSTQSAESQPQGSNK